MYAFIKGVLVEAGPVAAIVDINGIGYKIFIAPNALIHLPRVGTQVCFHTSLVIREFIQALYGFLNAHERDLFEALLNVNGIGPKLALSLIGHMSLGELRNAIANEDIGTMTKVPGIGKKTAERLMVELHDKLGQLFPVSPHDLAVHLPSDPQSQTVRDAMSALINLGYNQQTAQKAIKKTIKEFSEDLDLPTLITASLQNI